LRAGGKFVLKLKVARIDRVTARIRKFEFVGADAPSLPPFTAGAHIDVELGNGLERSYSLINDPGEIHRYAVAVLREADGRGGSAWMHDVLSAGDILNASEPVNNFSLSEAGEHHILIAGGIGVTPILAMAARLQELRLDYALHYCARSSDEAAFADEITARHGTRAAFYYDGGDPAHGLDVVSLLATRRAATHVYVCGPPSLIRATREAGRHWPAGTVHYELFKGSPLDIATEDPPFEIVLQRSGKTLTVPSDRSILDILKEHGFAVRSLCREGVCGTCRVAVVAGMVDHRDDCLDDADRAHALQACVSRAMPGETLILDL
jgi:vanillate monooxygenase ferredoxin subunit